MKVLLDMDGVLADFFTNALALFQTDWDDVFKRYKSLPLVYDCGRWIQDASFGRVRVDEKALTDKINSQQQFWLNLKPYPWTTMLVELLEKKIGNDLYICSAPWLHTCHDQKVEWIEKYFPQLRRRIILTDHKELMANPQHILIDDCDANVVKFGQCGGQSIVFPQPWNSGNAITESFEKLSFIKSMLTKLIP